MAEPEWERSKENIAPERGGRDVKVLNKALRTPKDQLEAQRVVQEAEVRDAIAGLGPHRDDPLQAWTRYTKWIVENYPEGSDTLIRAIEEVCRMYAKTKRYRDDIRFVRLWIRYIDLRGDKLDVFNYMNRKRIGESWSLFYEAWAVTLEIARQYDDAERVYRTGRERQAKPVERLALREREYYNRMAARRRRDEKKMRDSEKKRLLEIQRDEARRDRESSRMGSTLANAVLSEPDVEETSAGPGTSVHRVRPALGQINEHQAKSGRRPFVWERKQHRFDESTQRMFSQSREKSQGVKSQKFEIYTDSSSPPAMCRTELNSKQMEDEDSPIPALAKKDEARKEDEGRLPSKWAGEVLPQENALKSKLQRPSGPPFEVYQDPEAEPPSCDATMGLAIKDIRGRSAESVNNFDDILEGRDVALRTSLDANRKSWPRSLLNPVTDGSGSPTITTRLAMKEVDDIFNSSFPMERDSESITLETSVVQSAPDKAFERARTRNACEYASFTEEKENALQRRPRSNNGSSSDGNLVQENRFLQSRPDPERSSVRKLGNYQREPHNLRRTNPSDESRIQLPNRGTSSELGKSKDYDMTEFLASWCNSDPLFQLLEDSDPEVTADALFDLQCRQGLVSLNVDKYRWAGHCHHSYVVLADDLNNTFGLMGMSEDRGSDEDEFKVVAVKVSRSSNAWEYYIYKTIHSRLSTSSRSIPRAIAFCEGNPKSYLILDSYANCSLQEAVSLLGEEKLSESLSMFFTISILRAVEDLHGVDMIHSDVTLDNLLFRNDLTVDVSKHPYSASGENGWSRWGVFLVDYNHAVDASHPQLRRSEGISLAQQLANQGNSFLKGEYHIPNAETWAYNGDCYSASVCAAKMLGISGPNFRSHLNGLQHVSTWEKFFVKMQGLHASSTARDTSEAMRLCRIEMEGILAMDQLLAMSLMRLTNTIIDAENEDMTTGL